MKKTAPILLSIAAVLLLAVSSHTARAQSIKLLGGDILNGALNGTALGGAAMALQNESSLDALRIGAGAGTLYGIGTGIYDVTLVSGGAYFYKSGTFNDGTNSSILVLMDTIYGAATGAIVGTSVSLLSRGDLLRGLRLGTGIGAWTGFGFGLVDSFVLAEGPDEYSSAASTNAAGGMVAYTDEKSGFSVDVIRPAMLTRKMVGERGVEVRSDPALEIFRFRLAL